MHEEDSDETVEDDVPEKKKPISEIREITYCSDDIKDIYHYGFKCEGCNTEPIEGSRWSCIDCLHLISLCSNCKISEWTSETHSNNHNFEEVRVKIFFDEDYQNATEYKSESRHLDINLMSL